MESQVTNFINLCSNEFYFNCTFLTACAQFYELHLFKSMLDFSHLLQSFVIYTLRVLALALHVSNL